MGKGINIKISRNGWFDVASTWHENRYYERMYNGCSKKEIKKLFSEYLQEEINKLTSTKE